MEQEGFRVCLNLQALVTVTGLAAPCSKSPNFQGEKQPTAGISVNTKHTQQITAPAKSSVFSG